MATSYIKIKGWWGTVEGFHTDESVYSAGETKALGTSANPPNTAIRRLQVVYTRTPTGSVEDVAVTTHDFMNITAGEPDDTWTSADFAAVETRMDTFFTAILTHLPSKVKVSEYRWYRTGPGIVPPNPPVRIVAKSITGTGGSMIPPQCAISVTERTGVRKEWGRFYLPAGVQNTCDPNTGRILSTAQTTISNAAGALYQGCASDDFAPVVYGKARQKVYTVEKVQVDDLFDVVRRRRYDRPLSRLVTNVP